MKQHEIMEMIHQQENENISSTWWYNKEKEFWIWMNLKFHKTFVMSVCVCVDIDLDPWFATYSEINI